ncbi:MAG: hypothetical protein JST69_06680 [Bacteroidetes bacterium]|nr:hypothetical protein [Bacteroidota bacterium]
MKTILAVILIFILASCASLSPVGKWDYQISGTPQGTFSGVLTVAKKDKKVLSAEMKSDNGNIPFNSFTFDAKTKKSTGDFSYMGMTVYLDAAVTEKEMNGNVATQGMTFPFKSTRKTEAKK